jgi:transcriptional antiterminator RfaH
LSLVKELKPQHKHTLKTPLQWLVVKTKPRCEKKLELLLSQHGFLCYAITYSSLRQWSDRKKRVDLPLIPGVVFVAFTANWHTLFTMPYVTNILREFNKPALVKGRELENLKLLAQAWSGKDVVLQNNICNFERNDWVEVTSGQFKGVRGTLIDFKGKHRLQVQLDVLQWSVCLDISKSQVKKLNINLN